LIEKITAKLQSIKWHKTSYPGVRYREHGLRKHGVGKDRYFSIRYKIDGNLKEEALGWASEGWSAEKAALERAQLRKAHKTGEGAVSLQEKRDIEQARRKREQIEKERLEKENVSFASFFNDKYQSIAKMNKKPGTVKKETALCERWLNPSIGNTPLKEINPLSLERVKKRLLNAGRSPKTIQHVFAVARQTWNFAKREGYVIGESPTKQVKLPKIDNERQRFLTHEEASILLKNVKERSLQLHEMCLLSLHCGLRAGEIFKLTWADVDLGRKILMLQGTKSGKSRAAFMTEEVSNLFKKKVPGRPSNLVFMSSKGEQITSISNAFDRTIKEIGLNDGINDPKQRVCFHSLRHTYASWLVESGADLYVVQRLLGHANISMTTRYSHIGENLFTKTVQRLEENMKRSSKENVVSISK
jgi:site-specific recombinase XerD